MVCTREKILLNSRNEEFVQKYVSAKKKKKLSLAGVSEKIYMKNGPFSLPGIKHSLKNTFPLNEKTASSGKKIENGFY